VIHILKLFSFFMRSGVLNLGSLRPLFSSNLAPRGHLQKSQKTLSLSASDGHIGSVKKSSQTGKSSQCCLKKIPKKNHSPLTLAEKTQCTS
ncbi:MAG TPA: hypothetical protein PLY23_09450, partial [Alphaproteobacteria bacterium]|nr:hypothetical protein [Alphaproteobacteria bacterium]HQS94825.1 hypothetical protein [Alphaproteobacteria bacterium]